MSVDLILIFFQLKKFISPKSSAGYIEGMKIQLTYG